MAYQSRNINQYIKNQMTYNAPCEKITQNKYNVSDIFENEIGTGIIDEVVIIGKEINLVVKFDNGKTKMVTV